MANKRSVLGVAGPLLGGGYFTMTNQLERPLRSTPYLIFGLDHFGEDPYHLLPLPPQTVLVPLSAAFLNQWQWPKLGEVLSFQGIVSQSRLVDTTAHWLQAQQREMKMWQVSAQLSLNWLQHQHLDADISQLLTKLFLTDYQKARHGDLSFGELQAQQQQHVDQVIPGRISQLRSAQHVQRTTFATAQTVIGRWLPQHAVLTNASKFMARRSRADIAELTTFTQITDDQRADPASLDRYLFELTRQRNYLQTHQLPLIAPPAQFSDPLATTWQIDREVETLWQIKPLKQI